MNNEQILEDEFWANIRINPRTVPGIDNPDSLKSSIEKYRKMDIDEIIYHFTETEIPGSKEDVIHILLTDSNLVKIARLLHLIVEIQRAFQKSILDKYLIELEVDPDNYRMLKNKIMKLLLVEPNKIIKARILSVSHRRSNIESYEFNLDEDFNIDEFITNLQDVVEDELSSEDRRVRVDEPVLQDDFSVISVKYEKGIVRQEEFEDVHFDNPADWVTYEIHPKRKLVTLRGSRNKMAKRVLEISSQIVNETRELKAVEDPVINFKELDLNEEINIVNQELEEEEVKIVKYNYKRITYHNTELKGNPTISIKGNEVYKNELELKNNYNLLVNADRIEFNLEFTYELGGIEKTVEYIKEIDKKPKLDFESGIENREKLLIKEIINKIIENKNE